jgi:hypothetical protein
MTAEIIAELENMVAARLFSGQPWITDDQETISACHRKLVPPLTTPTKTRNGPRNRNQNDLSNV